MSGEILTCLGHTDWHYFEPCLNIDTTLIDFALNSLCLVKNLALNMGDFIYYDSDKCDIVGPLSNKRCKGTTTLSDGPQWK